MGNQRRRVWWLVVVVLAGASAASSDRDTLSAQTGTVLHGHVRILMPGRAAQNAQDAVIWLSGAALPSGSLASPLHTSTRPKMASEGKRFLPHVVAIQAGETIDFPNVDRIFHNAFSVSPGNVALKCLRVNIDRPDAASPLKEEIKLARMITHVNVVRVFDVGESGGRRFFTMEYVRGQTVRELLERGGAMDLTPALQIAKQVCRGLTAVHKAGIVHGDLKSLNVMVLPNGIAKLMDFGVARVRSQTAEGPIVGTPLYMSPEQARGAELDDRSDIYAAGVLMFELFTGRPPFQSEDVGEIMRMHQHDRPPNPRLLRQDLPEVLGRIILACLEKSRLPRPTTASDLERLLMRVRV